MIPMLHLCHSSPIFMPRNLEIMRVPRFMLPVIPIATPPAVYPPSNIHMYPSITATDEYDSCMYGRFQHVDRDYPQYRHAPFDWYRPPKQQYNVIHEDAAVLTLNGPIPIDDFYRYYIYGEGILDDYDSEEYEQSI